MTLTRYSRAELLCLSAHYQPAVNPISGCLWKRLCELGLCKRGPTARGYRSGAKKQPTIRTVLGNRPNMSLEGRSIRHARHLTCEINNCALSRP